MTYIAADWTIDRATGDHRYIGDDHAGASPSYATVIEGHRALQDLADDEISVGDDNWDILAPNPSKRSTDNIIEFINNVNIDANASEHYYDGSIIQNGGADIYDGFVNFGNSSNIQIAQNGGILADDWWNVVGGGGLNPDSAQGISHRFMLPTRVGGVDTDLRKILGISRNFQKTYSEFPVNGTARGNNVLALSESDDLNNQTDFAVVQAWTDIVNLNEGYVGIDLNDDGSPEFYYSQWDKVAHPINDLYERSKYLTAEGSAETLYDLPGEMFRGITHEFDVDTPTGTFNAFEPVSWAGGTGQMLAIDNATAGTKMYIQLLTGSLPLDNDVITGGTSGATVALNLTITERPIANPGVFIGASTGTSIIGAYGIGLDSGSVTAADKFTDLSATPITPPNFVTYVVFGLVPGEDRVLVAPWDGVAVDVEGNPVPHFTQMTLSTALTGAAETAVVVNAIPGGTPSTGTIRVTRDDGRGQLVSYTSFDSGTNTYTIPATDFSASPAAISNGVMNTYVDKLAGAASESFTAVYPGSDVQLVVFVRDGGITPIQEFVSPSNLTSGGGSITAIRTSDA